MWGAPQCPPYTGECTHRIFQANREQENRHATYIKLRKTPAMLNETTSSQRR